MPTSLLAQLLLLFVAGGILFALWKGGTAERAAAAVVLGNMALAIAREQIAPDFAILELINDGLSALILLGITLRYGAPWMGIVMLFYAVQFGLHSYYLVTERETGDYLYALVNNLNFSGITWCLIIGAAVAWRARTRAARAASA